MCRTKAAARPVQDLLANTVPLGVLGSAPVVPYGNDRQACCSPVTSRGSPIRCCPACRGMAESGYPDIDIAQWFGVFAPAGTPKEIVDRMAAVVERDHWPIPR